MTSASRIRTARRPARSTIVAGAAVVLVAAMAYSTTVVRIGSEAHVQPQGFSPDSFGAEQFPLIQADVEVRASDASTLAQAIATDRDAAVEEFGVGPNTGPVFPVRFTGVAGEARSGIYPVAVDGLPEGLGIRVQTGPAINGTDLRDATGTIQFGQFRNQIEYQNAGSAINEEMKRQVLADVDTASLAGRTLTVVGVFKLVNPNNWLVTPVRLDVE